eukprot:TRINITY_DN5898_c0_g1_i1.p1 TRINITY_DN5898_c0_g1~~TRINITY_DN5898_c0_g1_i1.p1  ORF type:complete len:427 (-),score=79.10 TRINITY_DN5898_c0_g1_i1:1433-2713(-)
MTQEQANTYYPPESEYESVPQVETETEGQTTVETTTSESSMAPSPVTQTSQMFKQQQIVKQRALSMDNTSTAQFANMHNDGGVPPLHTQFSLGYMQEPAMLPAQYMHSSPHSPIMPPYHGPPGMHGGMMHGMYNNGQYPHPYHPHQYQQTMFVRQGGEYGGGLGYGRGFLPMNNMMGGGSANMFRGGINNRGRGGNSLRVPRGGKQPFSRKNIVQEKLSNNKDRTVYVSEIDHNVTEEDLARLFSKCGEVVDCRLCGDAHSRMRFAFIEFSQETGHEAVAQALQLDNHLLGSYPIRVLRSRTAIVPVKRDMMPQSQEEMERCQRTVYVSNIDKRLSEEDVVNFFTTMCAGDEGEQGKVYKIRLLSDNNHATAIAFVEFVTPESASAALVQCQGALMGCLPLRVSPSKTPVRTQQEDLQLRKAAEGV